MWFIYISAGVTWLLLTLKVYINAFLLVNVLNVDKVLPKGVDKKDLLNTRAPFTDVD